MSLGNIGTSNLVFTNDPYAMGSKVQSNGEDATRQQIAAFGGTGKDPSKGSVGIDGERKTGSMEKSQDKGADEDHKVKDGYRSSPAECETCKTRKYQDGSDENVSFKAASHISPEEAPSRVRGHEGEHVANAYSKAAEKGGKVLAANVAIHTAICPECGRTYVSGGTTSTLISYPKDDHGKKDQANNKQDQNAGIQRPKSAVENFDL